MYTLDAAQDGERSVTLRRSGGAPLIYAAYHVPPGSHADFAAVEVLAQVLGDSPSGRLFKQLTEAKLASATFAFAWALADPALLVIGAQLTPEQDVEAARAALLRTAESVAREPISDTELQRAKTQWLNAWERAFTDPEQVGLSLSESIALGDWRLFFLARDRVRDLTLADLQRIADAHLKPANRTLGVYLPTEAPQRAPAPARVDIAATMAGFKPQAAAAAVEAFDASPANIDARTQRFTVGGLKAALLPKPTRGGAVQAVLTLRFGDSKSLFGQVAVGDAVAQLLDKGSTGLTRQQVQDRLEQLRAELNISSAPGQVTLAVSTRREHLAGAIALLAEMVRTPAFEPAAVDELKRQLQTRIESQRKEPRALASVVLARQGNPYPRGDVRHARDFDEMLQDLDTITPSSLKVFHQRFYGARSAEFGAAGDIDVAAVRAALQAGFGSWNAGAPFERVPMPFVDVKPALVTLQTPDKQNAEMRVRQFLPLNDLHADYPAMTMANYLLGMGGSSRLWKRIRESDGLSYDVRSGVQWNHFEDNSPWQASAIFAPGNRAKVEAAFRAELARALSEGFSAQELQEGQSGLLSFRRLSRAQDETLAHVLAANEYLGRDFSVSARVDAALAALTPAQVSAALRKYLKPEDFVSVFAGDFKP